MQQRKKLIEVALPLDAISTEAALRKRKAPAGYPTAIHRWWAQRPLAACRAVLFASIVDDPSSRTDLFPDEGAQQTERMRLFQIIEKLVKWENSGNERVLEAARQEIDKVTGGRALAVLDPFCGAGSIPLEAQRLGLKAFASDLNPVAVLITKALTEVPSKYAGRTSVSPDDASILKLGGARGRFHGLAQDIRHYGRWLQARAYKRLCEFYPPARLADGHETTVVAWLWARSVICPNPACRNAMPLVSDFKLSTRRQREAWIEPHLQAGRPVRWTIGGPSGTAPSPTQLAGRGRGFRCLTCGETATAHYIHAELDEAKGGQELMAVVAADGRHRAYLPPSDEQLVAVRSAKELWTRLQGEDKLPSEPARGTFGGNAQGRRYGFRAFSDYFTPRQLVTLVTLTDLMPEVMAKVVEDGGDRAYAGAIATYLACAISRVVDYGNALASWRSKDAAMRSLFARQAIAMVWDFAEGNPFGDSSSGVVACVDVVARVVENLPGGPAAEVRQLDATQAPTVAAIPLVCTDPPYYDNIGYADLADFFYVWLRRSLGRVYPDLFSTVLTPKSQELVANPYRFGGDRAKADQFFEHGLRLAFSLLAEEENPEYPLTLFYAFKQSEQSDNDAIVSTGWETMLTGLLASGLRVTGTWPMRTEGDNRNVSLGSNALASSIVLVCRPRSVAADLATRGDFIKSLRAELPDSLHKLQQGSIAPVDLAQAAIGPGMAVFSRYAKVIEADGSTMSIRTALGLINKAVDEILAEQEGDFDADTRFAVTWFEQRGLGAGEFGEADVLARAKNTSVAGMVDAGVLASHAGKVRLRSREELDPSWDPATDRRLTVWEIAQHLIQRLDQGGYEAAADLLRRIGSLGASGHDLAYRLYTIADRKGWTGEALAYNSLVVAWPEIARRVSGTAEAAAQQILEV